MSEESQGFYDLIGSVLRYGVIISCSIILIGVIMIVAGDRTPPFPANLEQLLSSNFGRPTTSISGLAKGLLSLEPVYIVQLGLLILLATPIARVVCSIFLFAAEKDRNYVSLTLFVLIVLLLSIFLVGPVFAA